jgi:hypothetical protein
MTAQLNPNQQLNTNDSLVSWNKRTTLIMQDDGNLVLYRTDNNQALWSSGTYGKPVTRAIMQPDGNLVCYDDHGVAYWSSGTWGNPDAFLMLQDDGDLVIYKQNGEPLWASLTMLTPSARLDPNQQLNINDKLIADNKRTILILQADGNLVLYRNFDNSPLWASDTAGEPVTRAIMQPDGNFVCYDRHETPLWSSGTQGHPGAWLQLQDDGNLAVLPVGTSTVPLWASMTTQNWDQADPGPPAFLIEFQPSGLIDVSSADNLANFIDLVQQATAPIAAKLQSASLTVAGPSIGTILNPDPKVGWESRIGVWLLSPYFPFAGADPGHPHQLPVLTPACAATGFQQVPLIGVPELNDLEQAVFAFSIPISALNTLAQAELPSIQSAASKVGATVSSITVTGQPPSVVTTISGSWGSPPAGMSGTITETPGLQKDAATGTMVPSVIGNFNAGSDVWNQVLLGATAFLGGDNVLGGLLVGEALGVTLLAPPALGGKVDPLVAQVTALVSMIPAQFPFETDKPVDALPDFPKLIFNWAAFFATGSDIKGRLRVNVVSRPAGSGSLTLTGPVSLAGSQSDMADGAAADYTVTWSDIAPTNDSYHPEDFTWQVSGTTGDSSGLISRQTFPFTQNFTADFPLPDPVNPGRYGFRLTVAATERDIKDPSAELTASAGREVVVHVRKDPKTQP